MLAALAGGVGSAYVGFIWYEDWRHRGDKIKKDWEEAQQAMALMVAFAPDEAKKLEDAPGYKALKYGHRRGITFPFLFAGLFMGAFGGIVAMERRGFSAALVLLTGAVGPLLVHAGGFKALIEMVQHEEGIGTLIWTSGLYLAAFLSLFVWAPHPKEDRKAKARKEEEEEEEKVTESNDQDDFDDDED
jgi:hypothetical protein